MLLNNIVGTFDYNDVLNYMINMLPFIAETNTSLCEVGRSPFLIREFKHKKIKNKKINKNLIPGKKNLRFSDFCIFVIHTD